MADKQEQPFALRMPPELRSYYQEQADQAGVSLNKYLNRVLEDRAGIIPNDPRDQRIIDIIEEQLKKNNLI